MEQSWFILENIRYDHKNRCLIGNNISGSYLGEMIVYIPESIDTDYLVNGDTVRVLAGPAMTMSIPPHLMNCTEIEVVKKG